LRASHQILDCIIGGIGKRLENQIDRSGTAICTEQRCITIGMGSDRNPTGEAPPTKSLG
jgi:hypothetical protein